MKRASLLALLLLSAGLVSRAYSQQPVKKAPPKPAPSPSAAIVGQWNEVARKLIAMAEDFPENKYDFTPAPGARSFAERLIHAAAANYYFTNLAVGQKVSSEEDPPRSQFKDKAALVAYL